MLSKISVMAAALICIAASSCGDADRKPAKAYAQTAPPMSGGSTTGSGISDAGPLSPSRSPIAPMGLVDAGAPDAGTALLPDAGVGAGMRFDPNLRDAGMGGAIRDGGVPGFRR